MNQNKKNLLPPIVVDYIEKLANKSAAPFQRESYCMTLERIRDACTTAINQYKTELSKYIPAKRK
jgi:hypothetical protein